MNETLVLLAAGMSTRYGRLKQLDPVGPGGEALLDFSVFDAWRAGFSRVLLIIREELEALFRSHIQGRWPRDLEVDVHHQRIEDLPGLGSGPGAPSGVADAARGRKKPWGTAHALLTARRWLPRSFAVINADDFYGAPAFRQAVGFLKETGRASAPTFGLVTYTLRDTLSEQGGVSRGVCRVDSEGWLDEIREVLDIRRTARGLGGRTIQGRAVVMQGDESISTNFWIFTPALFPILEAGFREFMGRQAGAPPSDQPEFLIPTVVNGAVRRGEARVWGIPTQGRFLGITHPGDREWVVDGLEDMTKEGDYPTPLWE